MNITLIYPILSKERSKIDENKQFWPPLGLAYIASVLERDGHRVQIIDRDVLLRTNKVDFNKTDTAMLGAIREFGPGLIGIGATTPNMTDVQHISRYLKKEYKDIGIILGGPHSSGEPVLSLEENPFVDAVARGEGEFIMCDIANGAPFEKMGGITYKSDGKIISNPPREPIRNIDELPLPARHLLDMKFYTRPSRFTSRNLSLRTTSIFTARGCPYRCNFCAGPLVFSGKVRFHSPGRVIGEIEELISKYPIEALYFAEDMFLSSRKRAEELLGLFIKNGFNKKIKWFAQAKADIITSDLLNLMKEAGCVGIEYGFESGSQRVLDLMNKKLKLQDSLNAAYLTKNSGLRFQANIIVGYPGEEEKDFKETIRFIRKIRPNMIGFNIFMPLPGTPSYGQLKKEGRAIPSWDRIGDPEAPQMNFADMPEGRFEKLYLEARLKVILPMNLRNFLMDNIKNPIRLLKIGLTQFGGVLLKTSRAILKLIFQHRVTLPGKIRVLYISYNGLLEPILPSQAIPYLRELAKRDFEFILLTYEKKKDLKRIGGKRIAMMKKELLSYGIKWRFLRYHKNPPGFSTLMDLSIGALYCLFLIPIGRIRIVHVRGVTPGAIILFLSKILTLKIIFDMRGLLAEEYVGGGLWKRENLSFKLVKWAEKNLLKRADAVTVLTRKHLCLNKNSSPLENRDIPMEVVPCCVDMAKFSYETKNDMGLKEELGLKDRFILMYPGKVGTFYLIKEMFGFYKKFLSFKPESVFLILTNSDPDPVFKQAKLIGVGKDKIRVVRDVSYEEIPRYFRIADAGIFFINPYEKIGSSPIKLGEFLASGVPVIINPGVGDTEEIVRDNRAGVVVTGFDDDHYSSAIAKLMRLREEGDGLRARCRETAKKELSLENGVNTYLSIYRELN